MLCPGLGACSLDMSGIFPVLEEPWESACIVLNAGSITQLCDPEQVTSLLWALCRHLFGGANSSAYLTAMMQSPNEMQSTRLALNKGSTNGNHLISTYS